MRIRPGTRERGRRPVTKLASKELAELDPYKFMAVNGYIVVAGSKPK